MTGDGVNRVSITTVIICEEVYELAVIINHNQKFRVNSAKHCSHCTKKTKQQEKKEKTDMSLV